MKSGKCPKCGSAEIFVAKNKFTKGGGMAGNRIPITLSKTAGLDNYVCKNCGYLERFISDPKDIEKISEKWDRFKKM